ncbi:MULTISPECIES: SurA N-terminal domain-containing protein [Rhodanobacter]|uniref:SurA N-terminal domain-containing protein n=1 Tax=Rhodanobacter TaxID=75309 RepID=UPI0004030C4A|nr:MULTISPECIES: SurA N-terminal domain-containing protein [Rhodanobacter]KZC20051.1 peptidylprolyl isomerase [Rhodanobacter denitrificans]UJJ49570.1 SurA N-terminal domain-containing protein [Rhodanobacter denitrificans]UJM92284.1 SurA N-terminal domain-containing protein [Rhodanobacter denitrificans]UJM95813.1 SurA N-terminal domain-containing protein [Rhodanobacter denitrificans]UJN21356.1 SurA N-terminal domain-containing protein [Rhodanobacter denitrificans]
MLQAMRNKMHGWPSIIVLGLAVLAMSLFGMESYFMSNDDAFVAKVGKHEIDQRAYQDRVNQLRQQAAEQQGEQFDSSAFEKNETKLRILDGMIDEQLLLQANGDWGLRVSDLAMRDYIASIPAFQVNGQFDGTSYRSWLTSQYKTPEMFENEIRTSLATQLLPAAINASTGASDAQLDSFLKLLGQRRDLRYFQLPRPALDNSTVSDAEIEAWYKAHQADYMNPEQVSVKYVEVVGADLPLAAEPSDQDLRKRYASEKQRFVQPEQRLVSHILINVPANATPEQQKTALAQAEKIAAQADPGDFAKLAEQDSQDLGSRRLGGDLGWLEKGVTNEAFDSALFAMQKGQISKPVLSSDGYHIIWLRDIRSGESKPFEEVREQLVKEATTADRDRTYNEVAGKMSDNTYQNPTSLEPASVALKLPIKTTALFTRKGGEGVAANPKVVAAAFSDDVLVQGNNSGLIDLGNNHSVVIHVDRHVPAAAKPLAEVRADVQQKILDARVAAIEKKQADEALARLRKGESMDAVAKSLGASITTANEVVRRAQIPAPLLTQAFLLPHPTEGKPQFAAVDMLDGSYVLLAVDKVQPGDRSKVPPEQRESLRQQMAQAYGYETTRELIDQLKAKTKIKINQQRL